MRKINYLLIGDKPADGRPLANGFHYTVNSQGLVLNAIDIRKPGSFMPKPAPGQEDLNRCSIGIKYNGKLSEDLQLSTLNSPTDSKLYTLNSKLTNLISLIVRLRSQFPSVPILGLNEIHGKDIHPSDAMNNLRRELSDYL